MKGIEHKLFILLGALIAIFLIISGIFFYLHHSVSPASKQTAYVDNKVCLQCHQQQGDEWKKSHHAMAMAPANSSTVSGDFNHASITHHGVTSTFFKRDDKFYVQTQGPDGKSAEFEIKYTFGVAPLQQYLIELPGGRIQNFTIAWDVAQKKWFDLYPQENTPPGDVLHWTGAYQNANMMCINCHTTSFQKNFMSDTNTYASTWSAGNVSCQSCHGPGEDHVRSAGLSKLNPSYHFKHGDTNAIVDTCGMCHSRRSELTSPAQAGQPLMDQYLPALLSRDLYYPDGQQLAEVYVYNSFRQSKMYQMGVSCIDCHNPHTGKLKAEGNAVCTQCHSPEGDKRFPTAAKLYDDPSHTFHKKDTPGAQCVSCHMPTKKFMQIHARPDHSIRIPRPDLTIKLGVPNACTQCHTNQSAAWAEKNISTWYGNKHYPIHYGEIIAAGQMRNPAAEEALVKLTLDNNQPSVVRATALELLRYYGADSVSASIQALQSEHPEIRRAAVLSLEKLPPSERLKYIAPLLTDKILAVRIEAAKTLSTVPNELFSDDQRKLFNAALTEYMNAQKINLDMPGANLNLAVVYENTGHAEEAEKYYRHALQIDPDFTPARLNLSQLYNNLNRKKEAETILREGISRNQKAGELQYTLGLLLAEEKRMPEAVLALEQAYTLLPNNTRVHYNYALALQQTGQRKQAEQVLLKLQKKQPDNSEFIYALAVFYTQNNEWKDALIWAKKLKALNPEDPAVQQFLQQVEAEAGVEK